MCLIENGSVKVKEIKPLFEYIKEKMINIDRYNG